MSDLAAIATQANPNQFQTAATKTSYSAFAKAFTVFGTTAGAFLFANTTDALSWLRSLWGATNKTDLPISNSITMVKAADLTNTANLVANANTADHHIAAIADLNADHQKPNIVTFQELALDTPKTTKNLAHPDPKLLSQTNPNLNEEFKISTYAYQNLYPAISVFAQNKLLVVWENYGEDYALYNGTNDGIYGMLLNSNGSTITNTEWPIPSALDYSQNKPAASNLNYSPNIMIVWQDAVQGNGMGYGIYGRIFDSTGTAVGAQFHINSGTFNCLNPAIAALINGNAIVTWQAGSHEIGSLTFDGIFAQIISSNGSPVGSEIHVNTYTYREQINPKVATLNNGRFVIVWQSYYQEQPTMADYGIYGQIFDSSGTKLGNELHINTYTTGDQYQPVVCGLKNNNFVVAWTSYGQDGGGRGIYAQILDNAGNKIANEFAVNTYTINDQEQPAIACLKDENDKFTIVWRSVGQDGDQGGIFGQIFNPDTTKFGNEFQVNTYIGGQQHLPAITATTANTFIVTWNSQVTTHEGIYAKVIPYNITIEPKIYNNRLQLYYNTSFIITSFSLAATANNNVSYFVPEYTFTIANLTHGVFSANGVITNTFSQQDILADRVVFSHDGSLFAPNYTVVVSDGSHTTAPKAPFVVFSTLPAPIFNKNFLNITQGQNITLTKNNIDIYDPNNLTDMFACITHMSHIIFKYIPYNTQIDCILKQSINNGTIIGITHDGSTTPPSYKVSINSNNIPQSPVSPTIIFNLLNGTTIIINPPIIPNSILSYAPTPVVTQVTPTPVATPVATTVTPTPVATTNNPTAAGTVNNPTPVATNGGPTTANPTSASTTTIPTISPTTGTFIPTLAPAVIPNATNTNLTTTAATDAATDFTTTTIIAASIGAAGAGIAGAAILFACKKRRQANIQASSSGASSVALASVTVELTPQKATRTRPAQRPQTPVRHNTTSSNHDRPEGARHKRSANITAGFVSARSRAEGQPQKSKQNKP